MRKKKELRNISDLAVFGAPPMFQAPLYVGRPNLGNRERFLERINDILDRRWLSNDGQIVQEFERELERFLGVKYAIPVCNGTAGLELAVRALDVEGEVIVPSFTFVATAHVLQWLRIKPVFVDIDPTTHNLAPDAVKRAITSRTSAILGVHLWGRPCPIEELTDIAKKHRLKLIFDAAHAFGCGYRGRMIGAFGDCEVFSFHATKFFNTGEGGAICTEDDILAEKLRLTKNFGFRGYDKVIQLGINGKMSEISAAMGLTNLEALDEIIAANQRNYLIYRDELAGLRGLKFVPYDPAEKQNYQYIIIEIEGETFGVSRDRLYEISHAENIIARRYFYPGVHRMEPYRTLDPDAGKRLRTTEELCRKILVLPTGTQVEPDDVWDVCRIIQFASRNAAELDKTAEDRKQI